MTAALTGRIGAPRRAATLAGLVGLALWLLAAAPTVLAHATYVRSEPPSGGRLAVPGRIIAYFSEEIDPGFSSLEVLDANLRRVDRRDVQPPPNDRKTLSISVPQLTDGTYTVAWRTLSAVDGHTVKGTFPVVVGEGSATTAAQAAEIVPEPLEVLVRAATFLGSILLLGGLAFTGLVLGPAERPAADRRTRRPLETAWERRFRHLGLITSATLAIAVLLGVGLQVAAAAGVSLFNIGGDPLQRYLATRNGLIGLAKLGVLALLAACLWRGSRGIWLAGGLPLVGVFMLGTSLTSHAAALSRGAELLTAADWLHQLAAGLWLGSLAATLLLLPEVIRAGSAERREILARLVPRLSALATVGVALLVATGVFAALIQVGSLPALATLYGNAIAAKVGILGGILILGAINNRLFTPWFAAAARPNAPPSDAAVSRNAHRFRLVLVGEVALGVVVLAATGVLTAAEPARDVWGRQPKPVDLGGSADDLALRLTIEPGRVGDNTYRVTLRDGAGNAPADVQRLQLRFNYVDQVLGRGTRTAEPVGPGSYQVAGTDLSIAGRWQVDVAIRRLNREDALRAFLIDVGVPGDPTRDAVLTLPVLRAPYAPLALAALVASLLGLGWSWLRGDLRRVQRRAMASGCAVVGTVSALLVVGSADFSPDLLTLRNPLSMTPAIIERGKEIYLSQGCADCHGDTGRGDGPLGIALRPPPADFRVHMAAGHTDGQIFDWLSNGFPGTAMRPYRNELTVEERWIVINFIRSFASDS